MSLAKRLGVAAVTVAAAASLSSALWPPARPHTAQSAQQELAAEGAANQEQQAVNAQARKRTAEAAKMGADAAKAEARDASGAADDLVKSILERP